MDNQITVRIPAEMKAAVQLEAEDKGVSMGVIVRWALRDWYRAQARDIEGGRQSGGEDED